jgi:hypothetical protein
MNFNFRLLLVGFISFACVYAALAQGPPLPPEDTPIDGGLISILLLGGGGALAAKKIRERRNHKAD